MNRFRIAVIASVAVASVIVSLIIQHRAVVEQRLRNETWRRQAEELVGLAAENNGLSNLVSQVRNSQPLTKSQLSELLKLRNEVGQLRQTGPELTRLAASNFQLRASASKADKQLLEAQAAPNYWPKDQLAYAGYGNPESAMRSLLAAMTAGDVSSWRAICTPEALAGMDQEAAKHGLSQSQQEANMKAMAQALMSPASGFHILDQTMPVPDEAVINLSFDGEGASRKFVLRKVDNNWKFDQLILSGGSGAGP